MQQYYDIFRQNGLVSLDKVEGIKDKYQLKEIGINKVAHHCLIMAKIRLLTIESITNGKEVNYDEEDEE